MLHVRHSVACVTRWFLHYTIVDEWLSATTIPDSLLWRMAEVRWHVTLVFGASTRHSGHNRAEQFIALTHMISGNING